MKKPGKPNAPSKLDDKALDAVVGGGDSETQKKSWFPPKVTVPDVKI